MIGSVAIDWLIDQFFSSYISSLELDPLPTTFLLLVTNIIRIRCRFGVCFPMSFVLTFKNFLIDDQFVYIILDQLFPILEYYLATQLFIFPYAHFFLARSIPIYLVQDVFFCSCGGYNEILRLG
jgi:hypothetical protein